MLNPLWIDFSGYIVLMLLELSIKNFAIIDDLRICFSDGLTMLTGETGAGKSIIINAVNLLLGSRASGSLIRTGAEAAELEALFSIHPESSVLQIVQELGFEASDDLLIRRIISRNDRHRIYINGRLSTIQMLNRMTGCLASISGQHAHQGLLKEDQHLMTLDQFAGLLPLRASVAEHYHEIVPLIQHLDSLKSVQQRQTEQADLLEFQKNEITSASLRPGEDVDLEQEMKRLKMAETLYQSVGSSYEMLYGAEGAIIGKLVENARLIEKASRIDSQLSDMAKALEDTVYQLEDIAHRLRGYLDTLQADDNRLEEIENRLDVIRRLKRKYGGSVDSVLSHLEIIDRQLGGLENLSEQIAGTESRLESRSVELATLCNELSGKRKQAAASLSAAVETELASLQMAHTRFHVFLQSSDPDEKAPRWLKTGGCRISESGIDTARFMIAPNPGEDLKPLSAIASGGELSRVVLALKAILADKESVETVVFDEVDAGIGGGTAELVGQKLLALSAWHQILCITHLPQIAKFGHHHYKISKQVLNGRTQSMIAEMSRQERIQEIARMLGGTNITQTTLDHAHEMLEKK